MTWNADNTAWNPIIPGASSSNPYHKLSHQGNGKWRMVPAGLGDNVESDGGSEDYESGHMFVLWETGEFYKAESRESPDSKEWRWSGSAWVEGDYGARYNNNHYYPYLEFTFSGNGPQRIYVGYAGYGTGVASNGRGANGFSESSIVNNAIDGATTINFPMPSGLTKPFYIDIPEVNPDNPAEAEGNRHTVVIKGMDANHNVLATDSITIDVGGGTGGEQVPPEPLISMNLANFNSGGTPVKSFYRTFSPSWPGTTGYSAINFPRYKLQSGQRPFDNRIAFTKETLTSEYKRVFSVDSVSDSDLQEWWNSVTKIKVKFAYYGHFGTKKGVYSGYDAWVTESRSPYPTPISGTIKIEGTNTNVTAQTLLSGSIVFPTASEYSAMQSYQREYAGALFSDNIEYEINVPDGASDNFWLDVNSGDHISSVGGAGNSTIQGPWKGVIMGGLNIEFPEVRYYALMSNEEDYEISTEGFVPVLISHTSP